MMIQAKDMPFDKLSDLIRKSEEQSIVIEQCCGQRYIASGMAGKEIIIRGTPGNALGAYLNGAVIRVCGNGQDAIGDTMNDGLIVIEGSCGDACGYAIRGGVIMVRGDAGYRAGIHMKAYQEKVPVLIIGRTAGSFLGEYLAGGLIIVLGLDKAPEQPIVGYFCGTGMHGGEIVLRCPKLPDNLPEQVTARVATIQDMAKLMPHLEQFCQTFVYSLTKVLEQTFFVLSPNTAHPYQQLYVDN